MLSVLVWIVAGVTAVSVVFNLATNAAKRKPWEIAFYLIYAAFVVVVLSLAALQLG